MGAGLRETDENCTVYINHESANPPTHQELAQKLSSKDDNDKIEALEDLILFMVNGEPYKQLLMQVIQFTVTSNNHRIKKLLMLYWEVVDKHKDDGGWREEMILVSNALRTDLLHANEYIRGGTLRLMCKMRYFKIIEPLFEAILSNLQHKHSYVRRNAVVCVHAILKTFGQEAVPTAIEDVEQVLLVEGDLSTKRNAFLMLLNCDMDRAINYLLATAESVSMSGDLFQLAALELIRRACRGSSSTAATGAGAAAGAAPNQNIQQNKQKLLRILYNMADPTISSISTNNSNTAVAYDIASSLVSLTSNPNAVTTAVQLYVNLITEQSDNNVKMIVLGRLKEVRKHHGEVVQNFLMDAFRGLSSPSLDVRKKVMELCLPLVSAKNVKEVIALFKKELIKTVGNNADYQSSGSSKDQKGEYRRMLIKALHVCTTHSQEDAESLVVLLIDFLTEAEYNATANDTIMYLREIVATYPSGSIRKTIINRLSSALPDMQHSRVLRGSLWLFAEYSDADDVVEITNSILEHLRPLPLIHIPKGEEKKKKTSVNGKPNVATTRTIVLADGTYGTETVTEQQLQVQEDAAREAESKKSVFRKLITFGDYLLAACLGVALTKLSLKLPASSDTVNVLKNEIIFLVANLIRLLKTAHKPPPHPENDSLLRLHLCIRVLTQSKDKNVAEIQQRWLSDQAKNNLHRVLEIESQNAEWSKDKLFDDSLESGEGGFGDLSAVPPNEAICFRQLRRDGRERVNASSLDFDDETDFAVATGTDQSNQRGSSLLFGERLANVQQMTGLADAIYVEGFLQVHSFDLLLEILLVNRTDEILQNVTVELSTQGDLKLVDRPQPVTLSPGEQRIVHASIKVSSTETGIIFGYCCFEKKSSIEKENIVLSEIHVEILDYIEKSNVSETRFRMMWAEFEWENKININTPILDAGSYLVHIMKHTNMSLVGRSEPMENSKDRNSSGSKDGLHNVKSNVTMNSKSLLAQKLTKDTFTNAFEVSNAIKTGDITPKYSAEQRQKMIENSHNQLDPSKRPIQHTIMRSCGKKHLTLNDIFCQFQDSLGVKRLLGGSCSFIAVNLYSRSIFGEDILMNVSIEQLRDPNTGAPLKISGSVRIRSRSQGIALSLGDRITVVQR